MENSGGGLMVMLSYMGNLIRRTNLMETLYCTFTQTFVPSSEEITSMEYLREVKTYRTDHVRCKNLTINKEFKVNLFNWLVLLTGKMELWSPFVHLIMKMKTMYLLMTNLVVSAFLKIHSKGRLTEHHILKEAK